MDAHVLKTFSEESLNILIKLNSKRNASFQFLAKRKVRYTNKSRSSIQDQQKMTKKDSMFYCTC